MKRFFSICAFFWVLLLNQLLFATYYDTGWKVFKQPNGTEFTGRMQGDEYYYKYFTRDGYPLDIGVGP